jgi:hypothetical protein
VEGELIRPRRSEFGPTILFARKAGGYLRLCIDYLGLNEVTWKDAYPLPHVNDTALDEHKEDNLYTHLDLASFIFTNTSSRRGRTQDGAADTRWPHGIGRNALRIVKCANDFSTNDTTRH